MFYRNWLNVGRSEQLSAPGAFFTRQVGDENLLCLRDSGQKAHAFFNVCQHRGTQLVAADAGDNLRSIICPYHAWTYGLDGRLQGAAHTEGLVNFDKRGVRLPEASLVEQSGFLFVRIGPAGPPFGSVLGPLFSRFERLRLDRLRLGGRMTYEVEANWKIIAENYSECYHCAPVHPGLNRVTPYTTGENDQYFGRSADGSRFAGGWMTFAKDFNSMTRSGYTSRPALSGSTMEDRRRIYYYTVFPNLLFSLHPDYLMLHRVWPTSPTHSTIENEFYFEPQTLRRPDFDPSDAVGMWDEINRQDWAVCEAAQRGSRSRSWKGGRYAEGESLVHDFDRFYLAELRRAGSPPGARSAH